MPRKDTATVSQSPSVKGDSSRSSAPSCQTDSIIEALKDATVAEAIACALGPYIAKAIDDALTKRLAPMQAFIDELSQESALLKTTLTEVRAENTRLTTQLLDHEARLEEIELYSRSHDLIVRGLPEGGFSETATSAAVDTNFSSMESHSSVASSIIKLCTEKLNVAIEPKDISVAHRLKRGKNDRTRPVIVRFTSRRIRDEIYRARKMLKNVGNASNVDNIYISEHLTKAGSALFYEARKMIKEKKLHTAWSYKGLINVKFTTSEDELPSIIRRMADFSLGPKMKPTTQNV